VNIENLLLLAAIFWSIDCARPGGASHMWSPKGPAGSLGVLASPGNVLQQMGLLQLASEPACNIRIFKLNDVQKITYSIMPVDMNVAEVYNLERFLPR
jgi:hypothetical protein